MREEAHVTRSSRMSIFSGDGSDNPEAGDQGGPMAPLAKVI